MNQRPLASLLLAALLAAASPAPAPAAEPERIPAGYRVEKIDIPDGLALEVGGMDFRDDGHLFLSTRFGEIWDYHGGAWSKFAEGLHEPLGVLVDEATGHVLVAQKPELTELRDTDGDGRADLYRTVNDDWGMSTNYHEYVFGPVRDREGNLYINLNLTAIKDGPGSVRKSVMAHDAPWRGWCVQITPDGRFVPFASGLRSPAGIGVSPDDEIFVTDNQGDWVSTSTLFHIERGKFYGHPSSLADTPEYGDKDLNAVPIEEFDKLRVRPAVWFPHNTLANSPGNPVWDTTGGRFGPFEGQIFIGDQTQSNVVRVSLEKVRGQYQGAAFDFISHLECGIIRSVFAADGSLWVGQTERGWGSKGDEPYGLRRIVYDGETIPFEMKTIRVTPHGFRIELTRELDPARGVGPTDFKIEHWGYEYRPDYGSPRDGVTAVTPQEVRLADDHRSIELVLPELVTERVYGITAAGLVGADGAAMSCDTAYYTLNVLPESR